MGTPKLMSIMGCLQKLPSVNKRGEGVKIFVQTEYCIRCLIIRMISCHTR